MKYFRSRPGYLHKIAGEHETVKVGLADAEPVERPQLQVIGQVRPVSAQPTNLVPALNYLQLWRPTFPLLGLFRTALVVWR